MSSKKNTGKTTTSKKAAKKNSTETPAKLAIDYSKLKKDTQLVPLDEWDWERVVISDPQKSDIPDGSGSYYRARIQYLYADGTIGPAIVELGKHYCFGVQPDNTDKDGNVLKDKDTGLPKPLRGYRMPIVMTSQNATVKEPTAEEQREVDFFDEWKNHVIKYAVDNKAGIKKAAKSDEAVASLVSSILYRKGESDGEVDETVSPKLYISLKYFPKNKEIGTAFYGPGDKKLDPLKMTGHFDVYATVQFESIYIGGKTISLQYKVYDATVEPITRAPKKRLARPNTVAPEEQDEEAGNEKPEMMESEDEAEVEENGEDFEYEE